MRTARQVLDLMQGYLALALAGCAVACLPPAPVQPTPVQLSTGRSPVEVISVAARTLASDGFTISVSDGSAGVLTAIRMRTPEQQGADVVCIYAPGSIAARTSETHLQINVTATAVQQGSAVQIVASVVAKSGTSVDPILRLPDSATDCASTGAVEKRIAARVSAL